MADTASPKSPPKTLTTATLKKPKSKAAGVKLVKKTHPNKDPTHPKTSEMVLNTIKELNERKGSSLQAIKKHIAATYQVNSDKLAIFIRNYLKKAVVSGELTQTKGSGASGSFKIATVEKKTSTTAVPKKRLAKGETTEKKVKTTTKSVADKKKSVKTITKKEKTPVKKSSKSKATKSAPKEKKSARKLPTTIKVKTPKLNKAPSSKPKKAAPKRK